MITYIPDKDFLRNFVNNGYPSINEIQGRKMDDLIKIAMIDYHNISAMRDIQQDFNQNPDAISKIYDTVQAAYHELTQSIGENPVSIFITLLNNEHSFIVSKLNGIMAHTMDSKTICLYISSKSISNVTFWDHLKFNIAHEYIHIIRNLRNLSNEYLIDYCIDEGLAEYIVYKLYGISSIRPWAKVNQETISLLKKKVFSKAYTTDKREIFAYLQGDVHLKIPRWTGYQVGFYLIDNLIENGIPFDELLYLNGLEIFNLYRE
ncbi:DUF2268 domain-containing putative Zn-dependent protease [Sporosarcina sp. Marseille-Q4943]|uniref:DUF2268 domain-containing putative Zn-dependent protease n=1 Tax=Sporosarcina sp. Marseille-Q4943 TaxID=2942204 RepID=UPI00208DBEF6|nr:DUF2268 domain-containing putative Zn-dependent protease [Sporosarcina sp. Marseille-Q4943]